jgi:hypothetical protein
VNQNKYQNMSLDELIRALKELEIRVNNFKASATCRVQDFSHNHKMEWDKLKVTIYIDENNTITVESGEPEMLCDSYREMADGMKRYLDSQNVSDIMKKFFFFFDMMHSFKFIEEEKAQQIKSAIEKYQ